MSMLTKPSYLAGGLNGLLILFLIVLIVKKWDEIKALDSYRMIMLITVLSIALGIHSIVHSNLEAAYKWNPLETGKLY
jgi:hypothetical protein